LFKKAAVPALALNKCAGNPAGRPPRGVEHSTPRADTDKPYFEGGLAVADGSSTVTSLGEWHNLLDAHLDVRSRSPARVMKRSMDPFRQGEATLC